MKLLNIYIHCASDILTDYESHGEGLICFSLLNGLAKNGHKVWAFTPKSAIKNKHKNLKIITSTGPMPLNSLSPWKYSYEANRHYKELQKKERIDLVWRMNPIGYYCPIPPLTIDCPLLTGPIYYEWPGKTYSPKSRFGISLFKLLFPLGILGWKKTLRNSKAIICATKNHTLQMKKDYHKSFGFELPLIVPTIDTIPQKSRIDCIKIVFLANLSSNKRPVFFCKIIMQLIKLGINVRADIIGDGHEKKNVEQYIEKNNFKNNIIMRGKLPNNEIYSYLNEAHFFINTAVGEPYGRSIVESMSRGCVVISHNSGGPKDFIIDKETGILVDSEKEDQFTNKIIELSRDEEMLAKISKRAYKQTLAWSEKVIISNLEKELHKLL